MRDEDAFRNSAAAGRNRGYRGKICIHPAQVEAARTLCTPTAEEIAEAEAAVKAADPVIDSRMVDAVHVTMAREILHHAADG